MEEVSALNGGIDRCIFLVPARRKREGTASDWMHDVVVRLWDPEP